MPKITDICLQLTKTLQLFEVDKWKNEIRFISKKKLRAMKMVNDEIFALPWSLAFE